MKKNILILVICLLFGLHNLSQAQEKNTGKLEHSLKTMIETMIKKSQEEALDNKLIADKKIKYCQYTKNWSTSYIVYDGRYKYDIVKTNSIISPYKAMVVKYFTSYHKTGKTKEECLRAPWKITTSMGYDWLSIYLYQNGKWVYSDTIYPK